MLCTCKSEKVQYCLYHVLTSVMNEISGSQTQAQRLKAMERLKQFKCRVLISTDLVRLLIKINYVNIICVMNVSSTM